MWPAVTNVTRLHRAIIIIKAIIIEVLDVNRNYCDHLWPDVTRCDQCDQITKSSNNHQGHHYWGPWCQQILLWPPVTRWQSFKCGTKILNHFTTAGPLDGFPILFHSAWRWEGERNISTKITDDHMPVSKLDNGKREILATSNLDETEGFQCLGHSNWTTCSPLSQSCSGKFPTFSLSYWGANSITPEG